MLHFTRLSHKFYYIIYIKYICSILKILSNDLNKEFLLYKLNIHKKNNRMKFIIIFSIFCAISLTKAQLPGDPVNLNPPNCGLRPIAKGNDSRIVGGYEAIPGDWPWQLLIKHN